MANNPVLTGLLDAVQGWSPKGLEHPYLMLDGPLERWRQKAIGMPEAWKTVRESAERPLKDAVPADISVAVDQARRMALVGLLDRRADMRAAAWKRLEAAMAQKDWVNHAHRPMRLDLWYSGTCACMALAYDWLYPVLNDMQKSRLEDELVRRVQLFQEIQGQRSEWWASATHNWRSVICGEMGIALLAVLNLYPEWRETLTLSIEGVVASLDVQGKDGSYPEGVGYWGYGVGQAGWFAAALKGVSRDKIDLFTHPFLKVTGDFALNFTTPDGGCFGFEDGDHNSRPNAWLMALLAREYRRPDYQTLASPNDVMGFLFYDPELKPEPVSGKTAACFPDIETVACRSGWSDQATFFGLHAGKTTVNHSHLDIGTFVLSGRGKRLVSDPGVWPYDISSLFFNTEARWDYEANATIGHNTLLVNGQGQVYDAKAKGKILSTRFDAASDTMVCDAAAAYGGKLSRFIRYAAFLKPDIVLLVDDLQAGEASHFAWLLHPEGAVKLEGTRWCITEGAASLHLRFLGFDGLETGTGYRVGSADRTTFYRERDGEAVARANRYLSFETLHKTAEWLVPVIFKVSDTGKPDSLSGNIRSAGGKVEIGLQDGGMNRYVTIDREKRSIVVAEG